MSEVITQKEQETAQKLCGWLLPICEHNRSPFASWRAAGCSHTSRDGAVKDIDAHRSGVETALAEVRDAGRKEGIELAIVTAGPGGIISSEKLRGVIRALMHQRDQLLTLIERPGKALHGYCVECCRGGCHTRTCEVGKAIAEAHQIMQDRIVLEGTAIS